MNGRFFHKRAFYLAVIANRVSDPSSKLNMDAFYESKRGDPRLTMLILQFKHGASSICQLPLKADRLAEDTPTDFSEMNTVIRIIPTLSPSSPIRLSRLSPTRSNLHIHVSESADSGHHNLATPLYNAVLMLAFSPQRDVLSVNMLKNDTPGYRDALALLRVWAYQRGYGEGRRTCIGGFEGSGPLWNSVLELLIRGDEYHDTTNPKRRPFGNGLSSYQLFKAALNFLCMYVPQAMGCGSPFLSSA
jgi:U3 small nucleolar RNA-associated protein 22